MKDLRDFPAIEELLTDSDLVEYVALVPRPVAAEIVREEVSKAKEKFRAGKNVTRKTLMTQLAGALINAKRLEITRVINATGIVVHTNLGRAPLSEELFEAVKKTVTGYGNIEFDLKSGKRGSRGVACEKYLAVLTGAEAAAVVNNNAAALLIILNSLANRKEVLVSRGELVQIGGGFRIPDILRRAGGRLVEVGTTNITSADDYANAITPRTSVILKVHKSNFIQAGFTEEAEINDLVPVSKETGVVLVNDLGSGVLIPLRPMVGYDEPSAQQSVRAGADITCFSGDKMLGGVQAGLIVGRTELIKKIKKNPLFRTVRVDKIVFSMLEKLLRLYLEDRHTEEIYLWSQLQVAESELYRRGKAILEKIGKPSGVSVEATRAYMGGGSLPEASIPSVGIVFDTQYKPNQMLKKLRALDPPVIGRIQEERLVLDLKAVAESDLDNLVASIKSILKE